MSTPSLLPACVIRCMAGTEGCVATDLACICTNPAFEAAAAACIADCSPEDQAAGQAFWLAAISSTSVGPTPTSRWSTTSTPRSIRVTGVAPDLPLGNGTDTGPLVFETPNPGDSFQANTAAIAGGSVASALLVIVIISAVSLQRRRRRNTRANRANVNAEDDANLPAELPMTYVSDAHFRHSAQVPVTRPTAPTEKRDGLPSVGHS